MRYGILGRGFGLYGYLPALLNRQYDEVITLERYRETIRGRTDLAAYEHLVSYAADSHTLLQRCDVLIIAVRPLDQELILQEILHRKWRGMLVLEKPIASDPQRALLICEQLVESGITFRIGFTLGATSWSAELNRHIKAAGERATIITIEWLFHAHHYSNRIDTWKRYTAQGGGALRYYCIHFIGLLAMMAEWVPILCERRIERNGEEPACQFIVRNHNTQLRVVCNTAFEDSPIFAVTSSSNMQNTAISRLSDPLSELCEVERGNMPTWSHVGTDRRTDYLRAILDGLLDDSSAIYSAYIRHARLWQALETVSKPVFGTLSAGEIGERSLSCARPNGC